MFEVLLSVIIVLYFLFKGEYFRFRFDNFLLSISHDFVFWYLEEYVFYFFMDGLAKFLKEFDPIMYEFIFSLFKFRDVILDVVMVEDSSSFIHSYVLLINCML